MSHSFETITSFQNPKVKLIRKLRDKRERDKSGLFVLDYSRDFEKALSNGYQTEFILYCPEIAGTPPHLLQHSGGVIYTVSQDILQKASYRENPTGMVAVMRQKPIRQARDLAGLDVPLVLGLVDLRKPGNIGALLRSADAAGVGAVLLIDCTLDLYNPNLIRSSTGACFLDHIYTLTTAEALAFFTAAGYTTLAATPQGSADLYSIQISKKTAIILGTEDTGLDDQWLNHCTQRVKIPMNGKIADSLNVSVSGAILMYEAYRQQQR
ncbi:MAG: RNA methyltransferase [Anaerolineaceae bacterium]|nr:RNA methyltransferase [Anaerolineaceae bacterium]